MTALVQILRWLIVTQLTVETFARFAGVSSTNYTRMVATWKLLTRTPDELHYLKGTNINRLQIH